MTDSSQLLQKFHGMTRLSHELTVEILLTGVVVASQQHLVAEDFDDPIGAAGTPLQHLIIVFIDSCCYFYNRD